MKNKLTSLGSRVVFCAVVLSLASTAFAGDRGGTRGKGGNPRPINNQAARNAAKATVDSDSVMSGSLLNPSRNTSNSGADRFQGLISGLGDKK